MSINRNRKKLNVAITNSNYNCIQLNVNYPIYWDEGIVSKSKVKFLYSFKYRSYKSWKYNRKTQYK